METLRYATSADKREVLALWRRAGAVSTVTDDEESLGRVVARQALLVAEIDGTVVGSLIAAFDGWRGAMYRLAVDPHVRRQGIARRLVTLAEQRLAEQGCLRIAVIVLRDEAHATAFWSSVGYDEHPAVARFVKTQENPGATSRP